MLLVRWKIRVTRPEDLSTVMETFLTKVFCLESKSAPVCTVYLVSASNVERLASPFILIDTIF